jgi:hypothetical protein
VFVNNVTSSLVCRSLFKNEYFNFVLFGILLGQHVQHCCCRKEVVICKLYCDDLAQPSKVFRAVVMVLTQIEIASGAGIFFVEDDV